MSAKPAPTLQRVRSWGMVQESRSYVVSPRTVEEIRDVFAAARGRGCSVGCRGGGNSYGDAALVADGFLLDFRQMNRILEWDPDKGLLRVEPGCTIREAWRHTLEDGWWLPVVPGTMEVTFGGAAAMNIHGKNNFKLGTFGENIVAFDLLLTDGRLITCTPTENREIYLAAIGGLGMLGVFTSITYRMKRVHSGLLEVEPFAVASMEETFELFDRLEADADYLVGWHDGMVGGRSLGRGLVHRARDLKDGEDPDAATTLKLSHQNLPGRFFGVIPNSWLWAGLWFFLNDPGMRLVNAMKTWSGRRHAAKGVYRQAHAAYHFLLDYVPGWKKAYLPGGLIQFQAFVPKAHAVRVFEKLIEHAHRHGHPPYLCVTKRHKPDPFLMTHAVDGYSLAMDIKVTRRGKSAVWAMAEGMEELVLDAGGRLYFAKDSVMRPSTVERAYPKENLEVFLRLKRKLDPDLLLETDLFRRIFRPLLDARPTKTPGMTTSSSSGA